MSQNVSLPQYARVEQPFGVGHPTPHCPICGQAVVDDDGVTPCAHLAFVFVGEAGDFEYQSPSFAQRIEERDLGPVGLDGLDAYLLEAGYGNGLLAIEITHGGMACGPVWYTEVFAFDYGTCGAS